MCNVELEVLLLVELEWVLCEVALAGVALNCVGSSRSRAPRSEPGCKTGSQIFGNEMAGAPLRVPFVDSLPFGT